MTNRPPNDFDQAVRKPTLAIILLLVFLAIAAIVAILLLGDGSPPKNELPSCFDYDLQKYSQIDPKLVAYRESAVFPIDMKTLRAIAVGPGDAIYVAGDQAVVVLDGEGKPLRRMDLDDQPRALAIDSTGTQFLAFKNYVSIYDSHGQRTAKWELAGPKSYFTSIALGDDQVFVADMGNRCVLRYDRSGKMIGKLAQADPKRDVPALVIPSPYFDVAFGSDGLLRVVNPGPHLIEFFTPDGIYEAPLTWGSPSMDDVTKFCGCCNPVAIALLADDRVVTAEKGIPRVKVYSPDGHFECVVATPKQLGASEGALEETRPEHKLLAVDLAVDSRGRILVLDPAARAVQVFISLEPQMDTDLHR